MELNVTVMISVQHTICPCRLEVDDLSSFGWPYVLLPAAFILCLICR